MSFCVRPHRRRTSSCCAICVCVGMLFHDSLHCDDVYQSLDWHGLTFTLAFVDVSVVRNDATVTIFYNVQITDTCLFTESTASNLSVP